MVLDNNFVEVLDSSFAEVEQELGSGFDKIVIEVELEVVAHKLEPLSFDRRNFEMVRKLLVEVVH